MKNYVIQPEDRHQIIFELLKAILNPNNKTIYIQNIFKKLPFSKNNSDQLCFNSWGFTKYALLNFFSIFSYSQFIIVVHSGARFNMDIKRFNKKNFFSYYFFFRSFLDKLFFILLNIRGKTKVCVLEDQTLKYIKSNSINKFLSKLFKVEYLNLSKINKIYFEKLYLKDLNNIYKKDQKKIELLSIGEFSEKRISRYKLIKMKNFFNMYDIKYSIKVCGKFDKKFREIVEEIGLKIYFLGFRSESELNSLINTSDYLLAAYHNRINDYGFQDTYFETKSTGLVLFNKPILII